MIYYVLAFSILSGTSLLLREDNLENLLAFVYGAWVECFETFNENRSLCTAKITIRRQKSILF